MSIFNKRPFYVLSNKLRRNRPPVEWMKEKWMADFSTPEKSCFIIKPEISYNANLEKGALFLGLKKKNCMAWIETEKRVYVDQVIDAHFHLDGPGSYCAAGIMFRAAGQRKAASGDSSSIASSIGTASSTYYLALISSKGYFRLDAVDNGIPKPLIGWIEAPGLNGNEAHLNIIAKGDHLIFILNGRWLAEAHDASIPGGHLGFALVSYDEDENHAGVSTGLEAEICRARLDSISVDAQPGAVAAEYEKWSDSPEISPESRFRLAHSLAALDCAADCAAGCAAGCAAPAAAPAYDQILKAWKQREETAVATAGAAATAEAEAMRTRGELLFAARIASRIGQYAAAEEYIQTSLTTVTENEEVLDILAEKAKILSAQNKYHELTVLLPEYIRMADTGTNSVNIPSLYALLGHAYWNLSDYHAAAAAWDNAFTLDLNNGLYAAHAARAYEKLDKPDKALQRYFDSARHLLLQKDYAELGAVISNLLALAPDSGEAHEAAAGWASAIGDKERALAETALAEKIKNPVVSKPAAKPIEPAKAPPPPAAETPETAAIAVAIEEEPAILAAEPAKASEDKPALSADEPAEARETEPQPEKAVEPIEAAEAKPKPAAAKKSAAKPKKAAEPAEAAETKAKPAAAKKTTAKPKKTAAPKTPAAEPVEAAEAKAKPAAAKKTAAKPKKAADLSEASEAKPKPATAKKTTAKKAPVKKAEKEPTAVKKSTAKPKAAAAKKTEAKPKKTAAVKKTAVKTKG